MGADNQVQVFRAAAAEAAQEPIVFEVETAGRVEAFSVPRPLPTAPFVEMALQVVDAGTAADRMVAEMVATGRFFKACLGDDWRRFMDVISAARFTDEDLARLMRWLIEEASGRPTTPPEGSPSSARSNGKKSKAGTQRKVSGSASGRSDGG